jgi:hypothetical protein
MLAAQALISDRRSNSRRDHSRFFIRVSRLA